jgi:DNA adenine methylase
MSNIKKIELKNLSINKSPTMDQEPTNQYKCVSCDKTYKYKSGLDKHNAAKHQSATEQQDVPKPHVQTINHVITPFIKWVGGKSQILDAIISRFPKHINNYYEPFLGGGSVLLGLLNAISANKIKLDGNIYASDLNDGLIATYINIKLTPETVIMETEILVTAYNTCPVMTVPAKSTSPQTLDEAMQSKENYYYWIRKLFNAMTPVEKQTAKGSANFIFLNKTCFRGLYREGPKGFNVPFGNYANPGIIDKQHIMQISAAIQNVNFTVCPYQTAIQQVKTGDFVYLDPPYVPKKETSFVDYTNSGFTQENHIELFKLCNDIARPQDGIKIIMSNADVKLVRDAFPSPNFTTTVIKCKRHINSKNPGATANEVIIQNY